ncbi:hypothetical protein [Thalassoglobus neptunius]|uniref:hypothetical protein n=1 Tax=Thalassoglobus neptunius TaxID=1938619 RepID=UPI0018D2416D|nr:hypothetical protein [Thalassoglobus neptunius]
MKPLNIEDLHEAGIDGIATEYQPNRGRAQVSNDRCWRDLFFESKEFWAGKTAMTKKIR